MATTGTPVVAQTDAHSRFSDQYFAAVTNPPFDPRRYSTNPAYAGVQQGLLIRSTNTTIGTSTDITTGNAIGTSAATAPSGVSPTVKLRFLYNPSDYTISYSPTDSVIAATNANNSGADSSSASTLIGASTTTASFSLLFDRTYELNSAINTPGSPDSHLTGVNVDTVVLQQLLGIPLDGNGFPLYLPVQLYLGGVNTLAFYGIITSAQVTYSHFSQTMVPLRAAVAISMQQWIDSSPSTAAGAPGQTTGIYSPPRAGTQPLVPGANNVAPVLKPVSTGTH